MCSQGKLWTTRYKKTKKTQLPLLRSQEQKQGVGGKSRVLRTPPALSTTKGWTDHLSHPSAQPLDTALPSLRTKNQLLPTSGSEQGNLLLVLAPPAVAGAPVKPCLNFLSGLLSISIDCGRPRTLVGITDLLHIRRHFSVVFTGARGSSWV